MICGKLYPDMSTSAPSTVLAPPTIALPLTEQFSALHSHPFTKEENEYNRYSITRSYIALAGELNRLTGVLGNLNPESREYDEILGHVKRVTKIMCAMTKLVEDYK